MGQWLAAGMANVLIDTKRQQVLALGRLGLTLRRIDEALSVRWKTASAYLKAAGIAVRAERHRVLPAKPAREVSTDRSEARPASLEPDQADRGLEYRTLADTAISAGMTRSRSSTFAASPTASRACLPQPPCHPLRSPHADPEGPA